jgi:hypothetical protein
MQASLEGPEGISTIDRDCKERDPLRVPSHLLQPKGGRSPPEFRSLQESAGCRPDRNAPSVARVTLDCDCHGLRWLIYYDLNRCFAGLENTFSQPADLPPATTEGA